MEVVDNSDRLAPWDMEVVDRGGQVCSAKNSFRGVEEADHRPQLAYCLHVAYLAAAGHSMDFLDVDRRDGEVTDKVDGEDEDYLVLPSSSNHQHWHPLCVSPQICPLSSLFHMQPLQRNLLPACRVAVDTRRRHRRGLLNASFWRVWHHYLGFHGPQ